jgi:hypothetical protein
MKLYEKRLWIGENHIWHVGIGVVKNVFKKFLNGTFISNSIDLLLFLFRKESTIVGGRAANAVDVDNELSEFQSTKEVKNNNN